MRQCSYQYVCVDQANNVFLVTVDKRRKRNRITRLKHARHIKSRNGLYHFARIVGAMCVVKVRNRYNTRKEGL